MHKMNYFKIVTGVLNKLRYVVFENIFNFYIKSVLEWRGQSKSIQNSENFSFLRLKPNLCA